MADEAYLFIPAELDHPAAGKTVAVPMDDFRANAKEWQAMGIRPARGEELAPIQKEFERQAAAESPVAAGLAAGARGLTGGLSDIAATRMGLTTPEELQTLSAANPNISSFGQQMAGLTTSAGLSTNPLLEGQLEASREITAGEELDPVAIGTPLARDLALAAAGGATGAGLKMAGRAAQRVAPLAQKGLEKVAKLPLEATIAADFMGAGGAATGAKATAGRILKGVELAKKVAPKLKERRIISDMAKQIRRGRSDISRGEARRLAERLRSLRVEENPLGGTSRALGNTTGMGAPSQSIRQQMARDLREADLLDAARNKGVPLSRDAARTAPMKPFDPDDLL